jgi:DNA-binding Lrp family transcriptional regulator
MDIKLLLEKLEGTQTIESITEILAIKRKKAIYYISRLRKNGYVKTKRLANNKRLYSISFQNKLGGYSYHEIINNNSVIKINEPEVYKIYGREPSLEETLVYAIKTKSLRIILASLPLFKKMKNWINLYRLSKANHIERQVGALYDLSRKIMKVRRMPDNFRNRSLPKKGTRYCHFIEGLNSKDFKEIQDIWKIYLPFNKGDLEAYL